MRRLLPALLLLLHPGLHLSSKCSKLAPSSFTQEQKAELCRNDTFIGPALCASLAHKSLHYGYPVILDLCISALSDAPANCVMMLKKARVEPRNGSALKIQGDAAAIAYCKDSRSDLPANCFIELSKLSGKHKLSDASVYAICHSLELEAPLVCMRAAMLKAALPAPQALAACNNATSNDYNATSMCLEEMVLLVDAARESGKANRAALARYCSHSGALGREARPASPGAACYSSSSGLAAALSPLERLALCEAAPVSEPTGPVQCIRHALGTFNKQQGSTHALPSEQAISLCMRANGSGPALCFDKSREFSTLSPISTRLALCTGAADSGPAACFKRAFRGAPAATETSALQLCIGAADDGPAQCYAAVPRYLTEDERVRLCHGAPVAAATEPGACVQRVEALLPSYRYMHKKVLGAAAALAGSDERAVRDEVLSMCSYGASPPLASAQCLKDAPRSMELVDALHMCSAGGCAASCAAGAARDWSSQEVAALCEGSTCSGVKASLRCATKLFSSALPRTLVVQVCSKEQEEGGALTCALEALKGAAAQYGTMARVCGGVAGDGNPHRALVAGQCLARVAKTYGSAMEESVAVHLCLQASPLGLFGCLGALRGPTVLLRDVDGCAAAVRAEPHSAKVIQLLSEDDTQSIIAGRRFSLLLQLYDQWGQRAGEGCSCRVIAAIDEGNAQGAVLWGSAPTASSTQGQVRLSNLMITQPGEVQLRLYCAESRWLLAQLVATVSPDPHASRCQGCQELFSLLSCPTDGWSQQGGEVDYAADSQRQRGQLPNNAYLLALGCAATLEDWRVSLHCSSSGSSHCWVEYRLGIDALWTGVGLPSAESSPERRLLLPEGWQHGSKGGREALRRAYRLASLQWHPDRWAATGLARYADAVKVAFQLVAEAYQTLSEQAQAQEQEQ